MGAIEICIGPPIYGIDFDTIEKAPDIAATIHRLDFVSKLPAWAINKGTIKTADFENKTFAQENQA